MKCFLSSLVTDAVKLMLDLNITYRFIILRKVNNKELFIHILPSFESRRINVKIDFQF